MRRSCMRSLLLTVNITFTVEDFNVHRARSAYAFILYNGTQEQTKRKKELKEYQEAKIIQ